MTKEKSKEEEDWYEEQLKEIDADQSHHKVNPPIKEEKK